MALFRCKKHISNLAIIVVVLQLVGCDFLSKDKPVENELKPPPISVQLWSVKNELKADFKGTIKALAQMGFQGVEFAGDFGPFKNTPKQLKTFLADNGLKVSGAHVGFDLLTDDKLEQTLSFYQQLGTELIIVPWDERAWHPEGVIELSKQLSILAEKVKPYGLIIGFHNHDQEFNDYQGSTYWDYIAQHTPSSVLLQLDVGWVNYAGKDPISYVNKYAGRTITTHYKVRTKEGDGVSPLLGQDGYSWAELIKHNVRVGGTKWIVVEQEEYPNGLTPMQSVAESKRGLDEIIHNL